MGRFLFSFVFVLSVILLQSGCSQVDRQSCAVISQSCIADCMNNNALSEEKRFRCQSTCADNAFACVSNHGGKLKSSDSIDSLSEEEPEPEIDIDSIKGEDIEPQQPLTEEQWSYVSIAGMTLIAGGVTATIFCGLNPVCLASAAAAVGLANYKYQLLLRGATLYENGVISAVRGVSSYAFGAAVGTAKNKLNPTVSRPDSLSNEDRINDFNKALMDELAHFYNLWR